MLAWRVIFPCVFLDYTLVLRLCHESIHLIDLRILDAILLLGSAVLLRLKTLVARAAIFSPRVISVS